MKNSKQIRGTEVVVGFSVGRAPLWMRGIRFAENGDGGDGGENAAAAATAAAAEAAAKADKAHESSKPLDGMYPREYVQSLRNESKTHRENHAATKTELTALQEKYNTDTAELEALRAEKAQRVRGDAIRAASKDVADADALLDSQAFTNAVKDVDMSKPDDVKAAVQKFVTANQRFAVAGGKPASRSGAAPTGAGHAGKPTSTRDAIGQHLAAQQARR